MGYIKSKSSYVIKTKHQVVNDGVIYERDAATIGGLRQFGSSSQVPVYNSGNFILTINNEDNTSKDISNNKWEENENGEVWTLNDVKNSSTSEDELDANIVLKQDYYSLKDFAYFGSCSELIRASINDILDRFPGEMFGTTIKSKGVDSGVIVYYTDTSSGVSIDKSEIKQLGGSNYFVLENPFNINMYTLDLTSNQIKDKLKYFCNDGYKNYSLYDKNNNLISAINSWVYNDTPPIKPGEVATCKKIGDKIGEIILNGTYKIYLYKGDNNVMYYLYEGNSLQNIHIRPNISFYNDFINSLDQFQKILLNPNTTPKYKAIFEVVSENDFGYMTTVKSFVMPLGNGGYNIGTTSIPFEIYLKELSDISSFYDDVFCDNLYRSMTHESIKNFDWTYNRESTNDESDEYKIGGNKIANLIRIYGRKFDDIKAYLDNISNSNTVTYNDVNNVPDYFLSDNLENDGWDVHNIYTVSLSEYITIDDNKVFREIKNETEFQPTINGLAVNETENKAGDYTINRLFKQDLNTLIKPYAKDNIGKYKDGYFNSCCNPKKIPFVSGMSNVYLDECASTPILRPLIQLYSSEKEYTPIEINNAFMKRLKINSRHLFRNKGTVEGIEMILAMFGFKSKKWYSMLSIDKAKSYKSDYEIKEYVSFTNHIQDLYNNDKKNFKTDWYNSTKLISYQTRDYNLSYTPYQGLPVAYREINKTTRRLYPFFDKNDYYDGNPYYQMNGGWLKKEKIQFDKDNNIIYNDDKSYTETLRTIKSIKDLQELITIPMQSLLDGDIIYVQDINKQLAIVDGKPYEIKTEEMDGNVYSYFSVYVNNGTLNIGDVYFYNFINVTYPYNPSNEIKIIFDELPNGSEVKVYIINNTIKAESNGVTFSNFTIFDNGKVKGFTNYFRINNIDYKDEISIYGWEQLSNTDKDYYRINAIMNYYKGNNPHNGNLNYDNGYEYLTYFKQIFKYAYNNDLFDKTCYGVDYYNEMDNIAKIGFKGLINDTDECDLNYPKLEDSKIHYFGNLSKNSPIVNNNLFAYQNVNGSKWVDYYKNSNIIDYFYDNDVNDLVNKKYNLKSIPKIHNTDSSGTITFYGNNESDGVTHQIVNNKRIDIIFNIGIDYNNLTKDKLEHIKYIDSVIAPYLTQFIPSTAICTIKYE